MAMAMAVMTTSAPKSGSRNSRNAASNMTDSKGKKPFLKLCMKAALRTV